MTLAADRDERLIHVPDVAESTLSSPRSTSIRRSKLVWRLLRGPFLRVVLAVAIFGMPAPSQGIITTVAGTDFVFTGEGKAAVGAALGSIGSVALDPSGKILLGDRDLHLVLRIAEGETLSVAAGNSIFNSTGDGGPANSASLVPSSLAFDSHGNLYIADLFGQRIRRVTPDGIISTVAGGGSSLQDGISATEALLATESMITVDGAGNLYVSDPDRHVVRRVTAAGIIATIAGNGLAGFAGDGGAANRASLNFPQGLTMDSAGNLYIADRDNLRIRRVAPDGIISTFAGNGITCCEGDGGPATDSTMAFPSGVDAAPNGDIYIAEIGGRIRRVTPDGIITTVAGLLDSQPRPPGDGGPARAFSEII